MRHKTLMQQFGESKYVRCPHGACDNWFPIKLMNRKHRDKPTRITWERSRWGWQRIIDESKNKN